MYHDDVKQGLCKDYHPDGITVKKETIYVNDRVEGPCKTFYESGALWEEFIDFGGVFEGSYKNFHENGIS